MTSTRLLAIALVPAALALPAGPAAAAAKPKAFASCGALNDYARKQALAIVGPDGLPFRFGFPAPMRRGGMPMPMPLAAPQEESAAGDMRAGVDYSGTNVQEEGVDEPDIVKTDGKRLYVAINSAVHVFDVTGAEPKLLGSIELKGYGHELLVSGDRLLALTTYYDDPVLQPQPEGARASSTYPYWSEPATRLFEIDVSDPAAPKLLNTLTVEGFYTSARLRGATARVVISTPPSPWVIDYGDGRDAPDDRELLAQQERQIRRSKVRRWVPDGVFRDRVRHKRELQRVVGCDDVRRPPKFAGPGMLTVLTLDLDKGLEPVDSDSLMTDAQTVYASKSSLFVATERWFDPTRSGPDALVGPGAHTTIHGFDISDPQAAHYRATGHVRGFVLNQFSLSEHDGVLRVATTEEPPWRPGAEQGDSESFVTTLEQTGPVLAELGRVGGLGKGERIYAVRFLGEKGYVVTFRQVDPLYTLDLSDPRRPAVRGELKIPGFSSYLHPAGDDLLIGIGQDATDEGRATGTQVSLFDVSDLADPKRLHKWSLGDGYSAAEYDHHAFLYWPPSKLSVVPLGYYRSEEDSFTGAVGLEIDRDKGIAERGRIEHGPTDGVPYASAIERSLVVGDKLLTVSYAGVGTNSLDTLAPLAFAPFPYEEQGGGGPVATDAPAEAGAP